MQSAKVPRKSCQDFYVFYVSQNGQEMTSKRTNMAYGVGTGAETMDNGTEGVNQEAK